MPSTRRLTVLAAAFLSVAALMTVAGTPPSGADGCSSQATDRTVTRQLGDRTYLLHVPEGLGGGPVPVLLSLHGMGQGAAPHEQETGWSGYAADHHFIVAYPEGVERRWDFGAGSTDVDFLRAVVDDIAATWCVDRHRVHAEGYSNGAMMVERLA